MLRKHRERLSCLNDFLAAMLFSIEEMKIKSSLLLRQRLVQELLDLLFNEEVLGAIDKIDRIDLWRRFYFHSFE